MSVEFGVLTGWGNVAYSHRELEPFEAAIAVEEAIPSRQPPGEGLIPHARLSRTAELLMGIGAVGLGGLGVTLGLYAVDQMARAGLFPHSLDIINPISPETIWAASPEQPDHLGPPPAYLDQEQTAFVPTQEAPSLPDDLAFLLLADGADANQIIRQVEQAGGHISQVFPQVLIGTVPEAVSLPIDQVPAVFRHSIDQGFIDTLSQESQLVARSWNTLLTSPQPDPEITAQAAQALANDAFTVPEEVKVQSQPSLITAQAGTHPPGWYDTSTAMVGNVAVDLILPQCDGTLEPCSETWNGAEIDLVKAEILGSLLWWADRDPRANLTFFYPADFGQVTPSRYEPIAHPHGFQQFWIDEAMIAKGIAGGENFFDKVYQHNNNLRAELGTDWAFTVFVVDSSHDDDNSFEGGYFAFAYLGGPFMVMTYGNDGYGIGNMDAVSAHEIGHIFYALDQYFSAYQACNFTAGYFGVPNLNSQYNPHGGLCPSNEYTIMRGQTFPYQIGAADPYARSQVGLQEAYGPDLSPSGYGNAVPGTDGVLDFAGLYYFTSQILTPTNELSATVKLSPFPQSLISSPSLIHINQVTGAWGKDYRGAPIVPTQLTISPDGQEAQLRFPLSKGSVQLCARGRFGGEYCQQVLTRTQVIFLPVMLKDYSR